MRLLVVFLVPVIAFVAAPALFPAIGDWRLGGIPSSWLIIGPLGLGTIVVIAWFHERRAVDIERRWSDEHREHSR